jgi:threonine aldolase
LYEVLSEASYVKSIKPVYTNIVIFELSDNINPIEFEKKLAEKGIRISTFGKQVIRMVTHRDISDEMMERVLDVLKRI